MSFQRRRDQRGVVLPTSVMFISIVAVAAAAIAFVLTARPHQAPEQAVPVAQPSQAPVTVAPTIKPKPKPKPPVNKSETLVVVFNNSNVKGLAGATSGRAQEAGWNVVGSDNWYGTISTSTVYYPQRLARAARLLAKDLGIARVKPAIEPMQFDRLTVVLTGDYRL